MSAFMFYAARHPFPEFGGAFLNIAIVSLGYVVMGAFIMYLLYGKKKAPLQTHAAPSADSDGEAETAGSQRAG